MHSLWKKEQRIVYANQVSMSEIGFFRQS